MKCRHCESELLTTMLDLGVAPPSNAYLTEAQLNDPEIFYPLRVLVCEQCWLVQTEDYAKAEDLFNCNYAYFSSTSSSWLEHARVYTESITRRLGLGRESFVIEIASNDGYLLKNFLASGIPCLGIEPTTSTADAAEKLGIEVIRDFFGVRLAESLAFNAKRADLIIGNNVLAHVPDINDFAAGLKSALKPGGSITLEFPHLMRLIEHTQFDTIYHEHFSYLSLTTICKILNRVGLRVFEVEELTTHGGSLRIFVCHAEDIRDQHISVATLMQAEVRNGLFQLATYQKFQASVDRIKKEFLFFLLEKNHAGKLVAAYGAAAKGNTLLNYAGVKPDLLSYVCDAAISKQGKYLPGSRIPILCPNELKRRGAEIILILPWNIASEVVSQLSPMLPPGTEFITVVPELRKIA